MKKPALLLSGVLFAALTACNSLKVSYDYDKQADFAKYKSYAFTDNALDLPIQQLNRDRLLKAIEKEMEAKGFSKSDQPDVWIDLHIRRQEKRDATATTTGPGLYGPRYGYAGGFSTTQVNYYEYVEGTLFVDMVDRSTEKIIWQGRGTRTVDETASTEKRERNINTGVQQIFSKYPPK